jgi:hypothetical protein
MKDFKKQRFAVVGVSENPDKFGQKIFRDLLKAGYKVFGVNPKEGELFGQKIYPTLKDISPKPDLVITVIPPPITEKIVDEAHELGIKTIWMQPGSESEIAVKKAEDYKMNVIHGACFMVTHGVWLTEKGY